MVLYVPSLTIRPVFSSITGGSSSTCLSMKPLTGSISLYETPPPSLKEGYLIQEGYNKELDELKDLRSGGPEFISHYDVGRSCDIGGSDLVARSCFAERRCGI